MMELPEMQSLVRDLDLTLQPRSAPRYKVWLPLATQQLRLRSLIQVIGHNLKADVKCDKCWFYYTLHRTVMSSPLYTSELIDNASPRWASFEVSTLHATGHSAASEIILRLWRRSAMGDSTSDIAMFAWGLSFTGLAYIGPKLPNNLETIFHDNSLIFLLHGGFFTPLYCLTNAPDLKRYLHMSVNMSEIRDSYTVNKLSSLQSKMQALKQQSESVQALRERIASGQDIQTSKYPQSSLNKLLRPREISREKRIEILRIRKELEVAKFRTKLLEQERIWKMGKLRVLNQLHASVVEENQDHGSDLMGRYRELNRDIERLREWRQSHMDTREAYIQTTSHLAYQRRQLISELSLIYPIVREDDGKFTINGIHLPDSEELESSNDTQVAAALGSVVHLIQMIANFLNVPTRYPMIHYGSRSKIIDHITDSLPDKDRQFPLFARGKDKVQFHYAVYLLNKNIAQLRWYCGLPTIDLRATLSNLASLINIRPNQPLLLDGSKRTSSGSSLDTEVSSGKPNAPLTPPFQKAIFEKCHRSSRSVGHLKTMKSSLGSSLDQGLDRPVQLLILSNQSKRICKSEENAIDDKTLSLLENRSSNSSNETINETIFDNMHHTEASSCKKPLVKISNTTLIEHNIEITIPTSIIKLKSSSECIENKNANRQRSSNSISSCEMALSSSQIDGEETSNDNTTKSEGNNECALSNDDKSESRVINTSLKCEESSNESSSTNDKYSMACDTVITETNREDCASLERKSETLSSPICNEKKLTDSSLSLDNIIQYDNEAIEQKQRTDSVCSYSDECPVTKKIAGRRRYDSEPRQNRDEAETFFGNWCTNEPDKSSEEQLKCFKHDLTLDKELLMANPLSRSSPNKEQAKFTDLQTSSEYIDSIKRSSENVFARTEALANKKTSFKVMKPRL